MLLDRWNSANFPNVIKRNAFGFFICHLRRYAISFIVVARNNFLIPEAYLR